MVGRRFIPGLVGLTMLAVVSAPPVQGATPQKRTVLLSEPAGAPALRDVAGYATNILPNLNPVKIEHEIARLGLTSFMGKPVGGRTVGAAARRVVDGALIATEPDWKETTCAVAIHPLNERYVVALSYRTESSWVYSRLSTDGGVTFPYGPFALPAAGADYVSCPSLTFTSDGDVLVAVYMANYGDTDYVMSSRSTDWGQTWSAPATAWSGNVDFPYVGIHPFDPSRAGIVYIAFRSFTAAGHSRVLVVRSTDQALTWPVTADVIAAGDATRLVSGGRAVGLNGTDDYVCAWYDSLADGPRVGKFKIEARRVWDYSTGAGATSTVAANIANECGMFLGPNGQYHFWWQTMFPAIAAAPDNRVLIAFTADPVLSSASAEDGNVYYSYNTNATCTRWLAKKVLASAGTAAQGYACIATQPLAGGGYRVYAAYQSYDAASKNLYYNICKRVSLNGGATFLAPVKVSRYRSLSDSWDLGFYNGLAAHPRLVYAVWGDRADVMRYTDIDVDIMGAAIDD